MRICHCVLSSLNGRSTECCRNCLNNTDKNYQPHVTLHDEISQLKERLRRLENQNYQPTPNTFYFIYY